jgi:hypothetical protein
MNLTAEQLQIASMIDAKMQKLVCGNDDITILGEMFDYMPGFASCSVGGRVSASKQTVMHPKC